MHNFVSKSRIICETDIMDLRHQSNAMCIMLGGEDI